MKKQTTSWIIAVALFLLPALSLHAQAQTTGQPASTDQPTEFKPSGKVWGYVFGDYYYKTHADSLSRGKTQYAGKSYPKDFNAFAFRRIYLGYDYNISEKFSTELLLTHESDVTDGSGDRIFYIKAANIRWKNIVKNNDLVVGQMATPLFALMSEKVWGYRSIEKTVADMRGFGSSNDVGVAWQGKLNDKGDYGYNFMVGNGTAQKIETDKYKKVYGELYAKLMGQKIIIDVSGDYEESATSPVAKNKTNIKGFVAYTTDPLTVGVEVVSQTQKNAVIDSLNGAHVNANMVPFAFSFFVRGQLIKSKLNFFARFDSYNPDTKFSESTLYPKASPYTGAKYTENFITAGLDFTPVKNVHFMPNIWVDTYKNKISSATGLAKSDYDMTARLTFYYVFR